MPYTDLAFLPAAQEMLACLSSSVAELTSPPARVGMRYGQQVVFDMAQNADLCCEGFAWVRMGTAAPVGDTARCNVTLWNLELELGIVRCAPMGDDQFIVAEVDHTAAALALAEDFVALRATICCFGDIHPGWEFAVGPYQPAGPEGGCMGGTVTVTVQIPGYDTFSVEQGAPPIAPLAPYTLGEDVGVPTGTDLTLTVGLPAEPDALEQITLTHPYTLAQTTLDVRVYRHRRWATTLQFIPAAGVVYMFDECEFDVPGEFFVVDVGDDNATVPFSPMTPSVLFRRCSFDGNSTSSRCLNADFAWVINCDMRNAEDAWGNPIFSVGINSNLVADTDAQFDPHPDGIQISSWGRMTMAGCWISAGLDPGANAAVRVGTEINAVTEIRLMACTFDRGGYSVQLRGDAGAADISDVVVQDCLWTGNSPNGLAGFGPHDFVEVTGVTWTNNTFLGDGLPVPSP